MTARAKDKTTAADAADVAADDAELAAAREQVGTAPVEPVGDTTPALVPQAGGSLWQGAGGALGGSPSGLTAAQLAGLELLRQPMPEHLLALKPINVAKEGPKRECGVCGSYTGAHRAHLTFAGHAAITDRLLAADPAWSWSPVTDPAVRGALPPGFWIELTVCGVTRLGYGDAEGKTGHTVPKELIGDALRNAAMRFGVGLELWHKGDLHAAREVQDPTAAATPHPTERAGVVAEPPPPTVEAAQAAVDRMMETESIATTTALLRDAGLHELLDFTVTIPTSPPQEVLLEVAFQRRLTWLRARQESQAQGAGG